MSMPKCDNCLTETWDLYQVGSYLACEDCYYRSQLPWFERLAEGH